jgi:hypothetical protein
MLREMCGPYGRLRCDLSRVAASTGVRRVGRALLVGVGDGDGDGDGDGGR